MSPTGSLHRLYSIEVLSQIMVLYWLDLADNLSLLTEDGADGMFTVLSLSPQMASSGTVRCLLFMKPYSHSDTLDFYARHKKKHEKFGGYVLQPGKLLHQSSWLCRLYASQKSLSTITMLFKYEFTLFTAVVFLQEMALTNKKYDGQLTI